MSFVRSARGTSPIVVEASFAAAPANVFEAWTNPELVMMWFGSVPGSLEFASIDLTVGGRWRFVEPSDDDTVVGFEGQYQEIVANERLRFTWAKFTETPSGERTSTPPSEVEIVFTETADGTDMSIVHSAVGPAERGFEVGWNMGIANLVELVES